MNGKKDTIPVKGTVKEFKTKISPLLALELVAGANANLFVIDKGSINRYLNFNDQQTVLVSNRNMFNSGYGISLGFDVNLCFPKKQKEDWGLRRKLNNSVGVSIGFLAYNNGLLTNYTDASGQINASEDIRITGLAFPIKLKFRKAYVGVQYNNNLFANKYQTFGSENSKLTDLERDLPDHLSASMGLRFSIFDLNIEYSPAFVFSEAASYQIIETNGYIISFKAAFSIPIKL